MSINSKLSRISIYILLLLLGFAWIWISAVPQGGTTAGAIPAPQEGFLAPDIDLERLNGDRIRLADLRGQAVLINIWASWCAPCRAEMPTMQRVYDKYHQRGFTILAVNATNQDNLDKAASFVNEYQLAFPILIDTNGEVSRVYQVRSLPTSFFVNPDGIIQEVVIGGPMSDVLLQTRVEKLLMEVP